MPFKKILVALDGSRNSQIAADYAFWLASNLDADVTGQYVVDPRLVDLFIEPEFAEELGFGQSVETSERVFSALRKIGKTVLALFAQEAAEKNMKITTYLSEGHVLEELLNYSRDCDLLILGHRGRGQTKTPGRLAIGAVAERVAREADIPVLIAMQPLDALNDIIVAFDGSESSIGALLMAESLARYTNCRLRAINVIPDEARSPEGRLIVEKGERYLREFWKTPVFEVKVGAVTETIIAEAQKTNALLVVGAYGFKDPDGNVLGSTTSGLIRNTPASVLIYRPQEARANGRKRDALKCVRG